MLKTYSAFADRLKKIELMAGKTQKKPTPSQSFIYGPVPSRRLGFSLGVDIVPFKTCTFDCIYCQLGKTPKKSARPRAFFSTREILSQIREALQSGQRFDHITFSGSGEPTLNIRSGDLIRRIKKITPIPVAVLTNSSLLCLRSVRQSLRAADVIIPSLDAATTDVLRKINRPRSSVEAKKIVESLIKFRREYKGQIWLEIMLVKGVNDSAAHIEALKRAVAKIKPDKVQLNTVVRPPAEKWARPLSRKELEAAQIKLGEKAEVVAVFAARPQSKAAKGLKQRILSMVERRPVSLKDLAASLGNAESDIQRVLAVLLRGKRVLKSKHKGISYYKPGAGRPHGTREAPLNK